MAEVVSVTGHDLPPDNNTRGVGGFGVFFSFPPQKSYKCCVERALPERLVWGSAKALSAVATAHDGVLIY